MTSLCTRQPLAGRPENGLIFIFCNYFSILLHCAFTYLKTKYRLASTWPRTKSVTEAGKPRSFRNVSPIFSWLIIPSVIPKASICFIFFSIPIKWPISCKNAPNTTWSEWPDFWASLAHCWACYKLRRKKSHY